MSPEQAAGARSDEHGLLPVAATSRPKGAIIKSTAIDPSVVDADGVYRRTGPARVFTSERAAIAAIKSRGEDRIRAGDVIVLAGRGPLGAGMEEIYQITSALKYLTSASTVALLTDARFSGVSTGRVHRPRRARSAGRRADRPSPRRRSRPRRRRSRAARRHDRPGHHGCVRHGRSGRRLASSRAARPASRPRAGPDLPPATRLWAALQNVSGGAWGGCVYDVDEIVERLK